jgi:hypothetical protein
VGFIVPSDNLKKGDYVLATKYHDGGMCDQWCIGWYDRSITYSERDVRHIVVDAAGVPFRATGFRRAKKISGQRGCFIVSRQAEIKRYELAGVEKPSLWAWARMKMSG